MKSSLSPREVTLILYRAAALQDKTWWIRSIRLAQRLPDEQTVRDLDDLCRLAEEMGISSEFVTKAANQLKRGGGSIDTVEL